MTAKGPLAAVIAVLAGVSILAAPSAAAVRHCGLKIVAVAEATGSEADARRQALDAWVSEARRLGEAYTSWRLATDRSVVCEKAAQGYRCRASATPCGISNNPDRAPKGSIPQGGPGKKMLDI